MVLSINYETKALEQIKYFKNYPILEYKITYPHFQSSYFFRSTQKLNLYYLNRAKHFERYCRTVLYRMAVELAEEAIAKEYPVMKFEAIENFQITYNENCAVSLYFDRYLFTGGAHGTTERSADTWELRGGGTKIALEELFPPNYPVRQSVISDIIAEIEQQSNADEVYFSDFKQNVEDTFQAENYYITPQGVEIFFQQYDIAPYSSGILSFFIPYHKNGPMPPKC